MTKKNDTAADVLTAHAINPISAEQDQLTLHDADFLFVRRLEGPRCQSTCSTPDATTSAFDFKYPAYVRCQLEFAHDGVHQWENRSRLFRLRW